MQKIPALDINLCNRCDGCLDISPQTFIYNESLGFIEVAELAEYNQEEVDEAIKNCPKNAIGWE
ncbi:MAG: ferredoxin [Desulfobulbaceae bacterium]|jgi:ferredoxin|nr:ferredoxin [Desulfobulbaceae bacterium]